MFVTAFNRRNNHRIITDGLVARWKLDGDLLDSVGSADGTLVGSGSSIGSSGLAMTGGADGGARFGNHDWFSGANTQFSLSFQAYANSLTKVARLFCKNAGADCGVNQRGLYTAIGASSGGSKFFFRIYSNLYGNPFLAIRTLESLSAGVQYHIALIYDGTKASTLTPVRFTCYIDGVEVELEYANSAGGSLPSIVSSTSQISMGTYVRDTGATCGAPNYTDATMQDTRVYDRLLTAAEAISITSGTG